MKTTFALALVLSALSSAALANCADPAGGTATFPVGTIGTNGAQFALPDGTKQFLASRTFAPKTCTHQCQAKPDGTAACRDGWQ